MMKKAINSFAWISMILGTVFVAIEVYKIVK